MKIYNFWLTAFGESGPDFETTSPLVKSRVVNLAGEGVGGRGAIKNEAKPNVFLKRNRMSLG